MFRPAIMFLPWLLHPAVPSGARIAFDPGGFDSQVSADRQGSLILARRTTGCTQPVRTAISPCGPVWIGKLEPDGQSFAFATYLGSDPLPAGTDLFLRAMRADRDGNTLLLAYTSRAVLPTVNALQPSILGQGSLYLCKLSADGSRLVYGTYLGGSGWDLPQALAVDGRGAAWVLAFTSSPDFPVTPDAPSTQAISRAAVTRISPSGALEYSATFEYLSIPPSLQVDSTGAALLVINNRVVRLSPETGQSNGFPLPGTPYSPLLAASAGGDIWVAGSISNGVLPTTPDAFQRASGASPLLRVVNGAAAVPALLPPTHQFRAFAADPDDSSRVFAATETGVLLSEDAGDTWARVLDQPAFSVDVDPFDSGQVWAGTTAGLYRSEDAGRTWSRLTSQDLPGSGPFQSVAHDPLAPGVVYATGQALYRSQDSGAHWTPYFFPSQPGGTPSSNLFTTPVIVRADPAVAGRVWVSSTMQCIGFCPVTPSIYRSDDAGQSFTRIPVSFTGSQAPDFAIAPGTGDLFVLNDGKLWRYPNAAFDGAEGLPLPGARAFALDPVDGALFVSTADGTLLRSGDAGQTWTRLSVTPSPSTRLAIVAGQVVLAAQLSDATDGFLLHYSPEGTLLYGTYFGGGATQVSAAGIGPTGHVFLAGSTAPGIPLRDAFQPDFGGGEKDAFVAEFDAAGTLLWSTYLGGESVDDVREVVPLQDGSVLVIGSGSLAGAAASVLGAGPGFAVRIGPQRAND